MSERWKKEVLESPRFFDFTINSNNVDNQCHIRKESNIINDIVERDDLIVFVFIVIVMAIILYSIYRKLYGSCCVNSEYTILK